MLCLCPSCLRCLCSAAPALWAALPLLPLLLQDTTKAGGCSSLPPCGPLPVPVGCLLCGGCLLFGSVGPFFGPSCALLCSACRSAPLGGFSRLLWPLPAFALLFLHKGGKKAALCSCLPLYLKRYAGGSVLLLPLCSCPKEGRPFGLCCGLLCLLLPSFSAASACRLSLR